MKTVLCTLIMLAILAQAGAQVSRIFKKDDIALQGYDPVAFFTESKPVKGSREISASWENATWYFSTLENKKLFEAEPYRYAPQYGGYCAFGAAEGHKAPTETSTWTIVDGKLYFNYNQKVKDMWLREQSALILRADSTWPKIRDQQ